MNNFKRFLYFILILITITSCSNSHDYSMQNHNSALHLESNDKLVVYLSGISHSFLTEDGSFTLYPSKQTFGTRDIGGELNCVNGNIFAQAITDYGTKTGIPIEIHFLEESDDSSDPLQTLYDQNKKLPDLLIVGKHTRYDYPCMANQNLLLDFTSYCDQDDALYDSDQYYTPVLMGGKIKDHQYIMPLLFNLNGFITSDSYLNEISMSEPDTTITFYDVLKLLEKSCLEMTYENSKEAIFDVNMIPAGRYIPSILTAAAYPNYWDSKFEDYILEKDTFTSIFTLMHCFNQQEFINLPNWNNDQYLINVNGLNKSVLLLNEMNEETYKKIGIFLTGGRCGGANFYNSLLTDAAYFHSVYTKADEEMVLCGIPTLEGSNTYSANISAFALGFRDTKYPEICYDLVRYLVDYKFPPVYGFSINKQHTTEQLNTIQNTTTTIYPSSVWSSISGGFLSQDDIENQTEEILPLDPFSISIIQNMLDHIVGAGIPYSPLEYYMYSSALNMIGSDEMTPAEVSNWLYEHLHIHLENLNNISPFYDKEYISSLKLGGFQSTT